MVLTCYLPSTAVHACYIDCRGVWAGPPAAASLVPCIPLQSCAFQPCAHRRRDALVSGGGGKSPGVSVSTGLGKAH